jgi:hypothetical protein
MPKRTSLLITLILALGLVLIRPTVISAATASPTPTPKAVKASPVPQLIATDSAVLGDQATASAETSTPSANVQKAQEKSDKDITESSSKTKDKLVELLDQHPVPKLSWYNPLGFGIRRAIAQGLPANIIVLILLFPLITSLISFSRHIVGLKGFGVYTPAVLAVAFVSTGIINGIILFLIILGAAMIMKKLLSRLNMQYLPRTAMLLWGVSIIILVVLIGFSYLPNIPLLTVSIFPLLIIILLTENFMETQLSSSQSEAVQLTMETLVTAIFCSLLINSEIVQGYFILQPEISLLLVGAFNIFIGRYSGLRLLEWIRFRSILEQ